MHMDILRRYRNATDEVERLALSCSLDTLLLLLLRFRCLHNALAMIGDLLIHGERGKRHRSLRCMQPQRVPRQLYVHSKGLIGDAAAIAAASWV